MIEREYDNAPRFIALRGTTEVADEEETEAEVVQPNLFGQEEKPEKPTKRYYGSVFGTSVLKLYKSPKTALQYNQPYHRYQDTLVLKLRYGDLEPVNIEDEERIAFYKRQIETWGSRLLESGLSIDERAVICEEMMLMWGDLMKRNMVDA